MREPVNTVSPEAGGRIVRRLRVVRTVLDREVRVRGELNAQPISCASGCAHCCDLFVLVDWLEAITLVRAYVEAHGCKAFHEQIWPRLVHAVELAKTCSRTDRTVDERAYHAAHVPCAFLDLETRTCSVYRDRPNPCRSLHVLSPPEACGLPDGKRWQLNVADLYERAQAEHAKISNHEGMGRPAFGFLADFVMRAARRMDAGPEDEGR